jgi:hypothetical protein
VFAENSHIGQAYIIIDVISALNTMTLILELKSFLLNMEYVLMYVPKVLATVVSICSLNVIPPLKMAYRYLPLFKNGMFRPFSYVHPQAFYVF